jgi:hypothetical protein
MDLIKAIITEFSQYGILMLEKSKLRILPDLTIMPVAL